MEREYYRNAGTQVKEGLITNWIFKQDVTEEIREWNGLDILFLKSPFSKDQNFISDDFLLSPWCVPLRFVIGFVVSVILQIIIRILQT